MIDPAPDPAPDPSSAYCAVTPSGRSRRAWATLLIVVVVALVADLWSKTLAFERVAGDPVTVTRQLVLDAERPGHIIPRHAPVVVVPRLLEFTLVLNEGAVFGIGAGKRWFFVLFTAGAMVFVLWMFAKGTGARDWVAHTGAGLLIAGGLGNMYDRVRFACVRDFIHPLPDLRIGDWVVWPYVSNVADLWVIIGIVLLLVRLWNTPQPETKSKAPGEANPDAESRKRTPPTS